MLLVLSGDEKYVARNFLNIIQVKGTLRKKVEIKDYSEQNKITDFRWLAKDLVR